MLKIRLTRRGKKNKAFFRLVVAEHSSPVKGRFLEALGFWDPHSKEKSFKEERIKYWLAKGAQCSDSVHNLLAGAGVIESAKRAVKIRKKLPKESQEAPEKKTEKAESPGDEAKAEKEAGKESKGETGENAEKKEKPADEKDVENDSKDDAKEKAKK